MKPIEKTFKAEKEILEEFFRNRKINKIIEDGLRGDEIYKTLYYDGEIKNPKELNVKNSFDLLEYLKPCFVYIASEINTIKEEVEKEHTDNLTMYQNYYFLITIKLANNIDCCYCLGFNIRDLKKEFYFKDFLYGNVLENYIKWENEEVGIGFMFNTKPISFYITVKIYRSYEYMFTQRRLNPKPKKQIIKAEKTFKEDNCVICLINPPNILYCNCGHQVLCEECSKKVESLKNCPICKTENTILRILQ